MPVKTKNRSYTTIFFSILFLGIFATACFDFWNYLLELCFGLTMDWSMIGRWVGHMFQGDFMLHHVPQSAPIPHESAIGWVTHYTIGITYAFLYCFTMLALKRKPTLLNCVVFSWALMLFPFLLVQPAMGAGYFSHLATQPWDARLTTFSFHTIFGIGLFKACQLEKTTKLLRKLLKNNKEPSIIDDLEQIRHH